jgi:hypothetical protein
MIIQAIKVWWDGDKLMTETIEPESMYSDIVSDGGFDPRNTATAQQDSTCNNALRIQGKAYPRTCAKCKLGPCVADRVQPPQRLWACLTFDDLPEEEFGNVEFLAGARWAARKLQERNT